MRLVFISLILLLAMTLRPAPSHAGDACAQLVMFEASYCEWCERWHEEIGGAYPNTDEGRAAPLRQVDIHDDRPVDLKALKAVTFTPTFVLVQDGREVGRLPGYIGQNFFWALLEDMFTKAGLGKSGSYCAP